MTFHDIRFPADISLGASGGPERKTDIVALASGHKQRNAPWVNSRRRYDAGKRDARAHPFRTAAKPVAA
ncbi:DUF2460 domain-containing protein [Rhizobium rhizosphaerae]|uniref:DUF2460 domain-containing protein n=1 Tax=Xaviernesmea rhizosphaerae TaxID=1672749 RepID=UPI0009BD1A9C